jgi:hypothetical protein
MARKKKRKEYTVIITSEATIQTTYRVEASSPERALAIVRSEGARAIHEEVTDQHDQYYEVDGVEIEP